MEDKTIRDKDGIIIYDPTDDACEEDNAGIMNDDELFTDEYMLAFAEESDRQIRRMTILDRIVSVVVILAVIGSVALVVSIFI